MRSLRSWLEGKWRQRQSSNAGGRPEAIRRKAIATNASIVLAVSLVGLPGGLYLLVQGMLLPFVMAVTVAASCGFATPMGYQTNLMIYGPGGYKFSDYMRFGGPLNLLVMALTVALAPLIWPFR